MINSAEPSKPKYNPSVMMEKQQQQQVAQQFGTPPPGLSGHQHPQVNQYGYQQNTYPMLSPGIMNAPPPHMQMADRNQVAAAAAAISGQQAQQQQHRNATAASANKMPQQSYPNYNWNANQLN
jgi:hypothetical protein